MKRACFYIDGFNLYYGIRSKTKLKVNKWRKFYWLDLNHMCQTIAGSHNIAVNRIKYFTAPVSKPEDKMIRQRRYFDALETLENIEIVKGYYSTRKSNRCPRCGKFFTCGCPRYHYKNEEKKTDVNIALHMLWDAYENEYDICCLISADSDLTTAIDIIKVQFPEKLVYIFSPPGRSSEDLKNSCHSNFPMNKGLFESSQFPDPIITKNGFEINCPESWKTPILSQ